MLLKANKYRKDKKADCRQNELGSRIFVGRVFVDYAKCLHFYPSFSYGRIIAGERPDAFLRLAVHFCPQCGQFRGIKMALFCGCQSGMTLLLPKSRKTPVKSRTILTLL